jgi:hypothetical protein
MYGKGIVWQWGLPIKTQKLKISNQQPYKLFLEGKKSLDEKF